MEMRRPVMFVGTAMLLIGAMIFCLKGASGKGDAEEKACKEACPLVYWQVCGSDDVTYDNECLLKLAACKRKEDIKKVKDGPC